MKCPVVHWELGVRDAQLARECYAQAFDWEHWPMPTQTEWSGYRLIRPSSPIRPDAAALPVTSPALLNV
jgi:hypothetical protein